MIKIPGLIDPHVHLRDPGQTYKEDFFTGTAAAIAGGFTTIIDMPNNLTPITTLRRLQAKEKSARPKIVCDVGFHFGTLGNNLDEFRKVINYVLGLKVYLNKTTGNFIVDINMFKAICKAWPKIKPILVHAEEDILEAVLQVGKEADQHIHVCHVSSKKELQIILKAKQEGQKLSCGVTPHHLFLTERDVPQLGQYGKMKPFLKTEKDREYLWKNIRSIDLVESDHAPHTKAEKESDTPPFGVPGLETTLPLLLTAVAKNRITIEEVVRLCHTNPAKIFAIQTDPQTYIEVDEKAKWRIKNKDLKTKHKWSPFNDWQVIGKVKSVFLRSTKVFDNNIILEKRGSTLYA